VNNFSDGRVTLSKEEQSKLFEMAYFYQRHPVLAVRDILGLPISAPHVRIVIREEWDHNHVVKLLSRGLMKTTLDAIMSLLSALIKPGTQNLSLGPTFRQGKFVFEQAGIEKMIRCEMGVQDRRAKYAWRSCKNPTRIISRGVDMWKIEFKNGSSILTAPIGVTGDNIRGLRAHATRLDEFKDFSDRIVNKVIKPMSNVLLNPLGDTDGNMESISNKFVYSGTIGYSDDHYSGVIDEYRRKMDEDDDTYDDDYAVMEFNYEDCFWIDSTETVVINSLNVDKLIDEKVLRFYYRINLSEIIKDKESETVDAEDWLSENKNIPLRLGSRYFSRDLIDSACSVEFTDTKDVNAKYKYPVALAEEGKFAEFSAFLEPLMCCDQKTIMGVDPARESDKTAIVIIRLGTLYGDPFSHVVYTYAEKGMSIKDQAVMIRELIKKFNVQRVYMDKKGNGVAIADELAEPDVIRDPGAVPIVDPSFDAKMLGISCTVPEARSILILLSPNVELNTVTASRLRAAFQNKALLIPKPLPIQPDPVISTLHRHIGALRGQLLKVKHKPVSGGLKFYIPEYKSKDESLEKGFKDLFSALQYAYFGVREFLDDGDDKPLSLSELDKIAPLAVQLGPR